MTYDTKVLLADLKRHEAVRTRLYFDSLGILTTGVGHALGSRPVPTVIQDAMSMPGMMDTPLHPDVVDLLLALDAAEADKQVRNLALLRGVNFDALSLIRQKVLVNSSFQLGATRLSHFVKFWAALARSDYHAAADEMLNSKWAKQTPKRAAELAASMRSG